MASFLPIRPKKLIIVCIVNVSLKYVCNAGTASSPSSVSYIYENVYMAIMYSIESMPCVIYSARLYCVYGLYSVH